MLNLPIVLFRTAEAAALVAATNAAGDPDWTYVVEASGERFVVAVYDEHGNKVGVL